MPIPTSRWKLFVPFLYSLTSFAVIKELRPFFAKLGLPETIGQCMRLVLTAPECLVVLHYIYNLYRIAGNFVHGVKIHYFRGQADRHEMLT